MDIGDYTSAPPPPPPKKENENVAPQIIVVQAIPTMNAEIDQENI